MNKNPLWQRRHLRTREQQVAWSRNPDLAEVVDRNIGTLLEVRRQIEQKRCLQDRIADAITSFSGSMLFVYVHVVWFVVWIALNVGHTGFKPFDPYPFGLLTMIVSLEAIFLSTFVLVSQNRLAVIADQRADLDLQVNLLSEHEITRLLVLVDAIADHLGITSGQNVEDEDLKHELSPELVLKEIELRQRERTAKK